MSTEYLNNKYLEGVIARFQRSKIDKAEFEVLLLKLKKTPGRRARRVPGSVLMTLEECQKECERCRWEFGDSQTMLATAFYTLSENIVRYAKFNLIDMDDAIQEGVMICFEKIDRFNPEIGKAFNYMTTCILNHFRQLYRTARNYNELKKKYHDYLLQTCVEDAIVKRSKERVARMAAKHNSQD